MGKLKNIVIHTADMPYGTAVLIDKIHRQKGWSAIGYNAVITNGVPDSRMYFNGEKWDWADGQIEWGRPFDQDDVVESVEVGAHVLGHNSESFGIALIGKDGNYTLKQMMVLFKLCNKLRERWTHLEPKHFLAHYELDTKGKTCPDIHADDLRKFLFEGLPLTQVRFGPKHDTKKFAADKTFFGCS